MKVKTKLWVLCRSKGRRLDPPSLRLLETVLELAAGSCERTILIFGTPAAIVPEGFHDVYWLPFAPTAAADTEARALAAAAKVERPDIILAPGTVWGKTIMPVAAALLRTGLTADCTKLEITENGLLLQTRPTFGGRLMAQILTPETKPQMATVRVNCAPLQRTCREIPVQLIQKEWAVSPFEGAELLGLMRGVNTPHHLERSSVVVAGGLGLGSRENFQIIHELAQKLGGAPAASRGAVNADYAPYSCQVGQSGQTIAPELYLAIGISGAVQHVAGIHRAKRIVAVNPDPKAPIFDHADIGILADWESFSQTLLRELESGLIGDFL